MMEDFEGVPKEVVEAGAVVPVKFKDAKKCSDVEAMTKKDLAALRKKEKAAKKPSKSKSK